MPDYSKQAKDLLHQLLRINSGYRNSAIDYFVDCIVKAAVEEIRRIDDDKETNFGKEGN